MTRYEGDWHNGDQLWWTDAKPGDKLELAVPVEKAGVYRVSVALTKARDYGIVQLYFDGKKAGEPIDLYNPTVIPSGPIELGSHDLTCRRAQADGRDRRSQPEGHPVLYVRDRPGYLGAVDCCGRESGRLTATHRGAPGAKRSSTHALPGGSRLNEDCPA